MDTKKTKKENGYSNCFPKRQLRSGYRSPDFIGDLYLRLPKSNNISYDNPVEEFVGFCFSLAHEEAHQIRPKSLVFC